MANDTWTTSPDEWGDLESSFWQKVSKGPDCWEWNGWRVPKGYGRFRRPHTNRTVAAHRLAFIFSHGPVAAGLDVCHRCDNPPCCNPDHLFAGTRLDNMQDCLAKGRHGSMIGSVTYSRGEVHGLSVLTETDVRTIRSLRAQGATYKALGQRFGVHRKTVADACNGRTWTHVV